MQHLLLSRVAQTSSLWVFTTISDTKQAMDFIKDLPPSQGFDVILTV
jgi:hypothetical protein